MAHRKNATDQERVKSKTAKLPKKGISEKDTKAVKGGTAGVKKTMQTQV